MATADAICPTTDGEAACALGFAMIRDAVVATCSAAEGLALVTEVELTALTAALATCTAAEGFDARMLSAVVVA